MQRLILSDMGLSVVLVGALAFGALVASIYGFSQWIQALGHRRPEVTLAWLLFWPWAMYDVDNFTPEGAPIHRRFILSIVVFALFAFGAMVSGAVLHGH